MIGAKSAARRRFREILGAEIRRHWPAESLVRAGLGLLVVLAIQSAFTLAMWREVQRSPSVIGGLWWSATAWLGLYTPLVGARPGMASPLAFFWVSQAAGLLSAPASTAMHFLAPGYAGAAVARARKHRRLHELLDAGLSPLQVLLVVGAASLAPFLALLAASTLMTLLPCAVAFAQELASPPGRSPAGLFGWSPAVYTAVGALLALVSHLLDCVLLVSLSAAFSRIFRGVAAAYAVTLLLLPAARAGVDVGLWYVAGGVQLFWYRNWGGYAVMAAVKLLAAAALVPLAVHAVRAAIERERPPARSAATEA